jgi:hypothetical protein
MRTAETALAGGSADVEHTALYELTDAVRANLSVELAKDRACGYAAGREDASGIPTVPAPGSPRGDGSGWLDFADAFAQAQDDYNHGRRGMGTNCKAAYERWTATGGRTIDDEADERAAAIRAAHNAGARRAWTDIDIPDGALDRATDSK